MAHHSHVCNAYFQNYSHSNIDAILKTKYGQSNVFTICFDSFESDFTTNKRKEPAQLFIMNENVNESYDKYGLCNKWNENNLLIFMKSEMDQMEQMNIKIKPIIVYQTILDVRNRWERKYRL